MVLRVHHTEVAPLPFVVAQQFVESSVSEDMARFLESSVCAPKQVALLSKSSDLDESSVELLSMNRGVDIDRLIEVASKAGTKSAVLSVWERDTLRSFYLN